MQIDIQSAINKQKTQNLSPTINYSPTEKIPVDFRYYL